jgi:hypothetical protein
LKNGNVKVIILALILVVTVTMTSGCIDRIWDIVEVNDGEEAQKNYTQEDYDSDLVNDTLNTADNTDKRNSEQSTDTKTITTTTTKKTSTPTKTESCSHPSVTTKYVGMDKATGKVIYDTYCSKCGEYLGRVKY